MFAETLISTSGIYSLVCNVPAEPIDLIGLKSILSRNSFLTPVTGLVNEGMSA